MNLAGLCPDRLKEICFFGPISHFSYSILISFLFHNNWIKIIMVYFWIWAIFYGSVSTSNECHEWNLEKYNSNQNYRNGHPILDSQNTTKVQKRTSMSVCFETNSFIYNLYRDCVFSIMFLIIFLHARRCDLVKLYFKTSKKLWVGFIQVMFHKKFD